MNKLYEELNRLNEERESLVSESEKIRNKIMKCNKNIRKIKEQIEKYEEEKRDIPITDHAYRRAFERIYPDLYREVESELVNIYNHHKEKFDHIYVTEIPITRTNLCMVVKNKTIITIKHMR